MANNIYRCSVALFGGRRALSDYHIHRYVLPWWHSVDAMLVLPASMASPRVVPLARHVGLKSCTHCTSAPLYQLHDIGLATPLFFSRNGAASFLYGKETPFLTIPDLVLLPACRGVGCRPLGDADRVLRRRGGTTHVVAVAGERLVPSSRGAEHGAGACVQRKRGRPGVHRDARFHARVAVRARSACVRACFGRHVRDGTWHPRVAACGRNSMCRVMCRCENDAHNQGE